MGQDDYYMDASFNLHYPDGATQVDNMPDELKPILHDYWATFPPQHPLVKDAFGVLFGILYIVAFFGNGCVLYVFLTSPALKNASNIFIVALAFSDLMMMTTQAVPVFLNAWISDYWAFGALNCQLYALSGGILGTASIWTMVVIGYDRYNVIVKGFNGVKLTKGKATIILIIIWIYSTALTATPFFGWGKFALEGQLITCSYDYMSENWDDRSFVMWAFCCHFVLPVSIGAFFYSQIVMAVVSHEKALKEQAKKMNVESLRSGEQANQNAEVKIAKVAITNVFLWVAIWLPYAAIVCIAIFGDKTIITPLGAQIPSMVAKTATCFNPIVFALSHPKYREALGKKFPCLVIQAEAPAAKPTS